MRKKLEEILLFDWTDEQREVITRVLTYFDTWKRWIPNSVANDILYVIDLAIDIKKRCKCEDISKI